MDKTNIIAAQTIPIKEVAQPLVNPASLRVRQDFNAYQSIATSNFMKLRKNGGQRGTIDNKSAILFKDGDYQLYSNYEEVKRVLEVNSCKFLLFALKKLAEQIPLKTPTEYVNGMMKIKQKEIKEFFGIKDKKYAKAIIINASRALLSSHHTFTFTRYDKKQVSREVGFNMTILDKYDYQNGVVTLKFSEKFLKYIPQQYIAQYPENIGKLSGTAFQITRYIYELHRKQAIDIMIKK